MSSPKDARVNSIFEILGAYFCDTFFNHIYRSAHLNTKNNSSLTDEYMRRVHAYVIGVKTDKECYSEVVQGIHSYFIGTTRFTTMSFNDFVDNVIKVCVPADYFTQFTQQDKDELLSSIICDLVSNIAIYTTQPDILRKIIDEHKTKAEITVRMIQDSIISFLTTKRTTIHNKFLQKIGQSREFVSIDTIKDMEKVIKRLVKEKSDLTSNFIALEKSMIDAKQQIRDGKIREQKLMRIIELLKIEISKGPAEAGNNVSAIPENKVGEKLFFIKESPIQKQTEQPIQRQTEQPIQRQTEPIQRQTEPIQKQTEHPIQRQTEHHIQRQTEQPIQRQTEQKIEEFKHFIDTQKNTSNLAEITNIKENNTSNLEKISSLGEQTDNYETLSMLDELDPIFEE
jgi:hypothetical protein